MKVPAGFDSAPHDLPPPVDRTASGEWRVGAARREGLMVKDRVSQAALPMVGCSRAIVVALQRRRPDTRQMPSAAAETAQKPVTCLVGLYESRDAALNADWDRFITLVAEAWCWRDPDCFAALEVSLANLRRSVDRDWS